MTECEFEIAISPIRPSNLHYKAVKAIYYDVVQPAFRLGIYHNILRGNKDLTAKFIPGIAANSESGSSEFHVPLNVKIRDMEYMLYLYGWKNIADYGDGDKIYYGDGDKIYRNNEHPGTKLTLLIGKNKDYLIINLCTCEKQ